MQMFVLYKGKRHFKRILIFVLLLSLCCCATLLRPASKNKIPDQESAIIFGKSVFFHNGRPIQYKGSWYLTKKSITLHISEYDGIDKLNENAFLPGEYAYRVSYDEEGYFAFSIAPGTYYFVEFAYWGIIPDSSNNAVGARTYADLPGTSTDQPYVITFEVAPNSANYIGTIKHSFNTSRLVPGLVSEYKYEISIIDKYENAKRWANETGFIFNDHLVKSMAKLIYDGL